MDISPCNLTQSDSILKSYLIGACSLSNNIKPLTLLEMLAAGIMHLTLRAMRCHVTAARASTSAPGWGGVTRSSMCLAMKEVSSSAASKAGC